MQFFQIKIGGRLVGIKTPIWMPSDPFKAYEWMVASGANAAASYHSTIVSRILRIPTTDKWIHVQSAFGGLGIYRTSVFLQSDYRCNSMGRELASVCEHVVFNSRLSGLGYELFINPQLKWKTQNHIWKMKLKYYLLLVFGRHLFGFLKEVGTHK